MDIKKLGLISNVSMLSLIATLGGCGTPKADTATELQAKANKLAATTSTLKKPAGGTPQTGIIPPVEDTKKDIIPPPAGDANNQGGKNSSTETDIIPRANTSSGGSADNTPAKIAPIPGANTSFIGSTEESKTTNPVEENSALIQSGILYEKWQEAEKKLDKITPEGYRLKAKLNDLRTKYKNDESNPEIKAAKTEIEKYLYNPFSVAYIEYNNAWMAYHDGIRNGYPIPAAAAAKKKLKKLEKMNKVVIPAATAN